MFSTLDMTETIIMRCASKNASAEGVGFGGVATREPKPVCQRGKRAEILQIWFRMTELIMRKEEITWHA